jgi:hypothetical protein
MLGALSGLGHSASATAPSRHYTVAVALVQKARQQPHPNRLLVTRAGAPHCVPTARPCVLGKSGDKREARKP